MSSNFGAALGGLAEGVGTALPEAFRDLNAHKEAMQKMSIMNQQNDRENQKFAIEKPGLEAESATKQALSEETIKKLQDQKIEDARKNALWDESKIPGDHAGLNAIKQYGLSKHFIEDGKPQTVGQHEATIADMHTHPEEFAPFAQKAWDETTAKVAEMKAPIAETQKELEEAQGRLQGPLTLAEKEKATKTVQKLQSQIAEANKGLEPLLKQQAETGQLLMEADKGAKVKQFVQDNKDTINSLPDAIQHAVKMNLSQGPDGIAGAIGVMNKYAEEQAKPVKQSVKGVDSKGRQVLEDEQGNLKYQDGSPYKGGQLKPLAHEPKISVNIGGPEAGGPSSPPQGTGEAGLSQYPKNIQLMAKKVANGDIPVPSSFALRSPYWVKVMEAASVYDPSFSATTFPMRAAIRKSFTSGPDAKNINSINTLVGHLDSLKKSADALDNTGTPLLNRVGNIASVASGGAKVKKFNMDLGAVESELAAVFKGTGASDEEIKAWRERISAADSPAQLKAEVQEAVQLMGSRLDSLKNKYTTGMGSTVGNITILSPKSRKILGSMGVDVNQLEAGPDNSAGGAATSGGNLTGEHDGKSVTVSGKKYPLNPDGTVTINGKKYKVQ